MNYVAAKQGTGKGSTQLTGILGYFVQYRLLKFCDCVSLVPDIALLSNCFCKKPRFSYILHDLLFGIGIWIWIWAEENLRSSHHASDGISLRAPFSILFSVAVYTYYIIHRDLDQMELKVKGKFVTSSKVKRGYLLGNEEIDFCRGFANF